MPRRPSPDPACPRRAVRPRAVASGAAPARRRPNAGRAADRASGGRALAGRRSVSAGHVLGAGLVCFASWLVLDGVQLKSNAIGAPVGLRRTVSIDALTPFAFVGSKFGLDRVARGVDDAISRQPAGAPVAVPPTTRPVATAGSTSSAPSVRRGPLIELPGAPRRVWVPASGGQTATGGTVLVHTISQPSAKRPITVLVIGDSLGEDLGIGLGDVVGSTPSVRLVDAATGSTGLANSTYYNWPAHLEADLAKYHPAIVVAMFGGNDWQSILVSKYTAASPGTPAWDAEYRTRVATIVEEATSAGAQLYWVGLPPMGAASQLPPTMAPSLNAIYRSVVNAHPGGTYVPSARLLEAHGAYAEYLRNAAGDLVQVRDPDGVHLDPPAGCDIVGDAAVGAIDRVNHIEL